MFRIFIAALALLSLACAGPADAATKKKRTHHTASAPVMSAPAPLYPYRAQTPGPPWASPNECYTDEGYGRYWPCGAGKGGAF
jgi:hypothetical protein